MVDLQSTDEAKAIAENLKHQAWCGYDVNRLSVAYLELLKQRDGLLEDLNAALGVKHKPSCNTTHFGCDCVLATLHRYKTALDWYADKDNWEHTIYLGDPITHYITPIGLDKGDRARQALAGEG